MRVPRVKSSNRAESQSGTGKIQQADSDETEKRERIAKRMARAGLCSRREAEVWIGEGRVSVNGEVLTTPAHTVGLTDRIEVDGNPLIGRERTRLWLYNKPAGLLSTNKDPEGRPTLFERLPKELPRMLSVGRLDMSTEGLLLMTNDGGLARILELPATGWLRRYRVRAHGVVDQAKLESLKDGIAVDGVLYGSVEAEVDRQQGSNTWLNVAIREGKNREVKNVLGAIGLEVNRLIRISYGPFQLSDLGSGEIREIRSRTLRDQLGERVIKQAGADFDAPLHAQLPKTTLKANEPGGTAKAGKKPAATKNKSRPTKKIARGQMAPGTMERLKTQNPGKADKKSGNKSGGKPTSYNSRHKANRKPGHKSK